MALVCCGNFMLFIEGPVAGLRLFQDLTRRIYQTNMFRLTRQVLALTLSLVAFANAQSVYFTQYPNQVLDDGAYPVSWEAGGTPVSVNLLRNGAYLSTIYSGAGTSFVWDLNNLDDVDGVDDGGTGFALRVVPQGDAAAGVTSGEIWLIGDDDGLLVNGQAITASVPWGPASSGLSSAAPPTPTAATATENPQTAATTADGNAETAASTTVPNSDLTTASEAAVTAAVPGGTRTDTFIFSSAQSTYTFTTEAPTATDASTEDETLTFTTDGSTFTTIIAGAAPSDAATAGASAGGGGGGGGGLPGGAIAGIVVGVLALVLLVVGLLWFRRRRRRQQAARRDDAPASRITTFFRGGRRALSKRKLGVGVAGAAKIDDEKPGQPRNMPFSHNATSEIDSTQLPSQTAAPSEIDSRQLPSEMAAGAAPVGAQHTGSSSISSESDGSTRNKMSTFPQSSMVSPATANTFSPSNTMSPIHELAGDDGSRYRT
ncbi:hypothetical protein LTR70_005055 [Exophiala xenobiotica]|uniref:Uncharacterized protein n=1 Tax=Lithohypha guttulata TaxID=1690604 RepID=A0ABR0K8M1_9EURO|nr:hypothetical protein LTR24_005531 [Lithohypha guttulata]KAK5319302.1 hypothetical protein LTR70_005055 [Exophiala xenobiotica]